jgi:hypothetical protein
MDKFGKSQEVASTTRREFAKSVAALAVVPFVGSDAKGATIDAGPDPAPKPDPLQVSSDALMAIVGSRYGEHIMEDQLKEIQRSIESRLRSGERLKRVKLQNSDEPDFIFSPDLP